MRILVGLALVTFTATLDEDRAPTVITASGRIKGFYQKSQQDRQYQSYEGIPYAQPPVGKLRFEPPKPIRPWVGELPATKPGSGCLQYLHIYDDPNERVTGAEDCLYLNVYTPLELNSSTSNQKLLPVIFYIHGGAFQYGAGNEMGQPYYLMNKEVVLVTIDYRLGPLGFLSTADELVSGNMGLKDQNLALRWVSENIRSFGGNPNSITLFGQSAGAASVHYHYLSQMSRGLFHRGASLSGIAFDCWTQTEASLAKAHKLGAIMGCPTNSNIELVRCLKSRPGKSIMEADPDFMGWLYNPFTPFGPVVEKNSPKPFIDKSPIEIIDSGEAADLPWITTVVSEDGLYPAAEFIADAERLRELNENWESIAPYLLDYNYTIPSSSHSRVADKIKEHYLGAQSIDKGTAATLIHMVSDRLYFVDGEKAARAQAKVSKNPIWFYYFSYRGEYSLSNALSGTDENFGVSHADDEFYIFPGPGGPVTTKPDLQMSEYMVNLLVSYATTGVPDAGIEWPPVDPSSKALVYLHISGPGEYSIENNTDFGEKNFWSTIDFNENKLPANYK